MEQHKIFRHIEKNEVILKVLSHRTTLTNWQLYTRTHFNIIATEINKIVSEKVLKNPKLISDFLLIGKDKVENIILDYRYGGIDDVLDHLNLDGNKPFNWISGKTLERYWKEENIKPKDLKWNVLLTFLDVPILNWDDWKYSSDLTVETPEPEKLIDNTDQRILTRKSKVFFNNIRNYYLGSYYLYYLKTDNNQQLIKTRFIIKSENDEIIVESVSERQTYRSTMVKRMQSNLYISCKNLNWNEEEIFLFNIGLETKPEVIFGVSITLTSKGSIPVAIKNVLIKESSDILALENTEEKQISLKNYNANTDERELAVINYFKNDISSPLLFGEFGMTIQEFIDMNS
ncbi:hypothetical protein [Maribacter sp. Asnod1-A12]|uniref:hypothetical protein n=1 Tax=Maribacter sp. Asnod1-A12 TaxID=3160576 RepID=UPI003869E12E